ncbi:MAG: FAD-dependent monooxygenase [Myxococcales bacterium]|nr:FAD-dependent monooxygenase [Myxococcales bacterium]
MTVIGGGPVGCVTAIAHANQGADVLVLEARSDAPTRLAGEWLHPPGANVLRDLGIEFPESTLHRPKGRGFVCFPDDGSHPIVLDYPQAQEGFSAEHAEIVTTLQEVVRAHPRIVFVPSARVAEVGKNELTVEVKGAPGNDRVLTERIVGADGRSSLTRKTLGYPEERLLLSYMAGVLLEDVELPFEGYGHVCLGGTGPALLYRIGERTVRLCLDVPIYHIKVKEKAAYLWDAYHAVLPESLRPAFHRALTERPIAWAANQVTPRRYFGRDEVALVGDAVGHYHPLTAVGMTLGFLDAECLSHSRDVDQYRRQRTHEGRVPELLANALYEVLTFYDDETVAVRNAVYRLWRENSEECRRTMRLLSSGDTELSSFAMAFCKVIGLAGESIVRTGTESGQWGYQTQVMARLAGRLGWLAAESFPELSQIVDRAAKVANINLKVTGELEESVQFHRLRHQPRAAERRRPAPRSRVSLTDATLGIERAVDHLIGLQGERGEWEGEVVWCPMLAAQYVLACVLMARELSESDKRRVLLHFQEQQLADGCWGLHESSEPYLFVTALVYVAARMLGIAANDKLLRRAGAFIQAQGGVVAIPTWGKFWLSMLNLYQWRGVNPLLPEMWLLPRWMPLHPSNFYCHTRLIYGAMAYIYGRKLQHPVSPLIAALRRELYVEDYERVDFRRAADQLRADEVIAPPSGALKLAYRACQLFESAHPQFLRDRMLRTLIEHIRFDVRYTAHKSISPVSGLLNLLAIWLDNPADAALDRGFEALRSWFWEDDERGLRVAGAKSEVWDTSFVLQALACVPDADESIEAAKERALDFLARQQVRAVDPVAESFYRQNQRGGFCFGALPYGWSVSDCTAEALLAFFETDPLAISTPDTIDAARFILRCQNPDGGFGSYEPRRTPWELEFVNPAEMFGNSMTEKSYVECSASCVQALAEFRRQVPGLLEGEINPAIDAAKSFIAKAQRPDGSWAGNWGINFTYGTLFGVRGLLACGVPPTAPPIRKACAWLIERQREDGGWGEHWSSCIDKEYVENGESQVIQTAWALMTLLEARSPEWGALTRAARFLLEAQSEDGGWPKQDGAGIFFDSAVLDYTLYREYFPIWALSLYEVRRRERAGLLEVDHHDESDAASGARRTSASA